MKNKLLLLAGLIHLLLNPGRLCAQSIYTIKFDTDGKIVSELPQQLKKGDKLIFDYSETEKSNPVKDQFVKALERTLKDLDDPKKREDLKKLYFLFHDTKFLNTDDLLDTWISDFIKKISGTISALKNNDYTYVTPDIPALNKSYADVKIEVTGADEDPKSSPASQSGIKTYIVKEKKVTFTLTRASYDQILYDWFHENEKQVIELPNREAFANTAAFTTTFEKRFKNIQQSSKTSCDSVEALNLDYKAYQANIEHLLKMDLGSWLIKWIWLNGTNIAWNSVTGMNLDPLYSAQKYPLADSIDYYSGKAEAMAKLMEKKENTQLVEYNEFSKLYAVAKQKSEAGKKQLAQRTEETAKKEKLKENKILKDDLIYKGFFYCDEDKKASFMRNHNAGNDYELMNECNKYYLEDDKIKILVQNQTATKESKLYEFISKTEDISVTGEHLSELVANFQSVGSISALFYEKAIKSGASDTIANTPGKGCPEKVAVLNAYKDKINALKPLLEWLSQQYQVYRLLEPVEDESPKFRTDEAGPSQPKEAPALVKYILKEKNISNDTSKVVTIDTLKYKIYALHRFQPFIGYGLGFATRNIPAFNDKNQLQDFNTEQNHSEGYAGVKIFLKKTDIHSSRCVFSPKQDWASRMCFIAGVDIKNTDPVDNAIAGFGVDIFPGLNVSLFHNIYRGKSYSIDQGIYTSQSKVMFDTGIMLSIDPIVVTRFYSLFTPKK